MSAKPLLLLLALLSGVPAAHAQAVLPAPSLLPPVAAAAPDTVAALHRLFAAERHKGRLALGVSAGAVGAGGLFIAVNPSLVTVVFGGAFLMADLVAAVPAGIQASTYSRGREQRMVRAWQQHRLPRRVRRQLQPGYFAAGLPQQP